MIKAFPIYQQTSGCDYHRIRLPFIHSGNYVDHKFYEGFTVQKAEDYFKASEILVYNRVFPTDKIAEYKKAGVKIVCDIDDYWVLHHEHPLYDGYVKGLMKTLIENMRLADMVTATTARLADMIRPYNSNVQVLPNALPFGWGQFKTGERGDSFIYTGLSSHLKDVHLLKSVMHELKTIKGLHFTLAGYKNEPVYNHMAAIMGKVDKFSALPMLPLDNYMDCYDGAGCSLVPLVANNFNQYKSNLKILEAAAKKLPAIVSHVPPYADDTDAPVLWVKHRSDWYKHIKALHESRAMREDYGAALHEWALKKYSLAYWNKVRFELYENLKHVSLYRCFGFA